MMKRVFIVAFIVVATIIAGLKTVDYGLRYHGGVGGVEVPKEVIENLERASRGDYKNVDKDVLIGFSGVLKKLSNDTDLKVRCILPADKVNMTTTTKVSSPHLKLVGSSS
jgi:hypothetical protein